VEEFLSKALFEREVDLYGGEVDHRMRDADVLEHVRAAFTRLILNKTVQKKERRRISQGQRLSTWKPYQATSTEKRPAVQATRTMFNLVPCENDFEQEFADFCDVAGDTAAFAKNAGPQKLMMDYLRPDGHRALYVPDYFVRLNQGDYLLVELKGKVDNLVPVKARAAVEWCKAASTGKSKWRYLYVPYHLFQQSAAATMEELARACEPSLKSLIEEAKTGQLQLPLFEATAKKEADERFAGVLQKAGMAAAPGEIEEAMRQAVQLLDNAVRMRMPDYSHAFQPLLRPLDEYAIKILENRLRPCIPKDAKQSRDYFSPYIDNLHQRDKVLLNKNQRYLKDNLVFGRSIQKLGTLLFCLDYAQTWALDVGGVWRDAKQVFSGKDMGDLYGDLKEVNAFRNTRVAHVETKLDDADEAWGAMVAWFRCLNQMHSMAG
jgi:type III restriction enzyme